MLTDRERWIRRAGQALLLTTLFTVVVDRLAPNTGLRPITLTLFSWALVLGAFALLLGIGHVAWIHLRRIQQGQQEWVFSLALVVSLLMVMVVGLFNPAGTQSPLVEWIFDSIIAPGQATLFALLGFFMAAAAYRLLRLDRRGGGWTLLGALLVLLVQMPVSSSLLPSALGGLVDWLVEQPVMAALRGALLGSGLLALLAGIRALVQADRRP